jgi:hypothetical protein
MPRAAGLPVSLRRAAPLLLAVSLVPALASQAQAKGKAKATATPVDTGSASGKIAVFPFDGDDFTNVRKHVIEALSNQGLEVDTSIKPVQTTEEFRDMGATLGLAIYLHGHINELPADKAEVTITVRSGVTGKTLSTVTMVGYRRGLRFDVEEKLWGRIGKVISRECKEATKPRRPGHEPMRIEAGSPL